MNSGKKKKNCNRIDSDAYLVFYNKESFSGHPCAPSFRKTGDAIVAQQVKNPTSILEDAGLIPGLAP